VIIVTGSATMDLLKQKEMFPGRRGNGRDLVMHPLDFASFACVVEGLDTKSGPLGELEHNMAANAVFETKLKTLLDTFLRTGGFPRCIQDQKRFGRISDETSRTYIDWLKGDWARAGRSDGYMKPLIAYIILARGTPISWNTTSEKAGFGSPHTVRTYVETLAGIHALIQLDLLRPDGRVDHKKNKKLHFTDPFIFSVMDDFANTVSPVEWVLEATVAAHLARAFPVFYWSRRTEVDVVCLAEGVQVGFEVTTGLKKWHPPRHLEAAHLVDKNNAHIILSALDTNQTG